LTGNFHILLIEDNPGDVRLVQEVLMKCNPIPDLQVIKDGEKARTYLNILANDNSFIPHLIILDLNLPRVDGRELLSLIKTNEQLKRIPVVIFSSSEADKDIRDCYQMHANCYVVKGFNFTQFNKSVHSVYDFWCHIVKQS
jgi:chemotaxis family two-component system response regulator Rcp1